MFSEVEADVYLMADGDGTYDACAAPALVAKLVDERLDMAVGVREGVTKDAGRRGTVLATACSTGSTPPFSVGTSPTSFPAIGF